jgi:hypothetical protein
MSQKEPRAEGRPSEIKTRYDWSIGPAEKIYQLSWSISLLSLVHT